MGLFQRPDPFTADAWGPLPGSTMVGPWPARSVTAATVGNQPPVTERGTTSCMNVVWLESTSWSPRRTPPRCSAPTAPRSVVAAAGHAWTACKSWSGQPWQALQTAPDWRWLWRPPVPHGGPLPSTSSAAATWSIASARPRLTTSGASVPSRQVQQHRCTDPGHAAHRGPAGPAHELGGHEQAALDRRVRVCDRLTRLCTVTRRASRTWSGSSCRSARWRAI